MRSSSSFSAFDVAIVNDRLNILSQRVEKESLAINSERERIGKKKKNEKKEEKRRRASRDSREIRHHSPSTRKIASNFFRANACKDRGMSDVDVS